MNPKFAILGYVIFDDVHRTPNLTYQLGTVEACITNIGNCCILFVVESLKKTLHRKLLSISWVLGGIPPTMSITKNAEVATPKCKKMGCDGYIDGIAVVPSNKK
jgi:hypothetical protein